MDAAYVIMCDEAATGMAKARSVFDRALLDLGGPVAPAAADDEEALADFMGGISMDQLIREES